MESTNERLAKGGLKVTKIIRVLSDGSTEMIEGESLQNFLEQENAALSLLVIHGWVHDDKRKIEWIRLSHRGAIILKEVY